jgi:phosphoribosylaminoimidazole-succinocarboxamide synthase
MTTTVTPILETHLEGVPLFKKGKVRDVYDLGDFLLIVATDRISAFDVVIPTGIPYKGAVLTALSAFWFGRMKDLVPSHFVSAQVDAMISRFPILAPHRSILEGRSMLVRKGQVIPIECVVRGYLAGSGWKDYCQTGTVCGVRLPSGLRESDELPEPIFTPATKAEVGHDLNISEEEMARRIGWDLTQRLKALSLKIYARARDEARDRGILIADTKFEFALCDRQPILVDELLTPDSSRFWPKDSYQPGRAQVSFDKQFVRDYLESIGWDKTPPAPPLPEDIVQKTSQRYLQALKQLTGIDWIEGKVAT